MRCDVVLVGGGLANCLIAYRLQQKRPEASLLLLERGRHLGGNHLWSFHDADLTADQRHWISPLVAHHWPSYEVRFPGHKRTLSGGYNSVASERVDRVLREALGADFPVAPHRVLSRTKVLSVEPHRVTLDSGETIEAGLVIDGRGAASSSHLTLAYQKFVGMEVELESEHELERPILMDATVDQLDGYRFLYSLPFGPRSLLIEDTRYSDGLELDGDDLRQEIESYAEAMGWTIRRHVREEKGVLPIVLAGDIEAFWNDAPAGLPRSGMRAALFHPTTGYSLPDAARLADEIAEHPQLESAAVYELVRRRSIESWRAHGFFRLLNRMLFRAAEPDQRYRVLERFYRLPEPLIERFYAGKASALDRIRILSGKPPVSLARAIAAMPPSSVR